MSSIKQIRQRKKSVTNTRKITRAMEMVAASKMKKAQDLALSSRDYTNEAKRILASLNNLQSDPIKNIFDKEESKSNKSLLLLITSDRGLSGSYNSSVIKLASQFIINSKDPVDIITIGKKGEDFFKNTRESIVASFNKLPDYPSTNDLKPIIKIAIDDFISDKYKDVVVAYTYFHSTIKNEALIEKILPINKPEDNNHIEVNQTEYLFEPNPQTVTNEILPKLVEANFYQYFLNSIASEYSSQMVAMKNASDNAKDIIDDLSVLYNTLRQASITQELAEITSGAAALE